MWTREWGDWFHRLTNGCWNKPSTPPSPLFPSSHPQFLLFSPFWSHQWCSHRGAWHQRQRCTHCTEVEPASYFALPIALHWANMHLVLFKITLQQRSATSVQAQCTNRQLGFTQILSLLQNEHCNGNGWARSCEGPSATFSEEADCTAVQPYHHQSNCSANGAECMHCCDSDLLMHTIFFGSFCAFAMSVCFILHVLANLWFWLGLLLTRHNSEAVALCQLQSRV